MNELIEGGCLCRHVRYQISQAPEAAAICHCISCRLAAGAESVAWAVVPIDGFSCTGSELRRYQSSESVERTFCGRCGSTITYQQKPETIDVTLATLDDPESLPPTQEVWCESRLSWNAANPALVQHDQAG